MTTLGIVLIAILAMLALGGVMIFIVIKVIKGTLTKVAHKAIDNVTGIGAGIANKATDRLLNIGEKELVTGIDSAKKAVSKSMLESNPQRMATEVTKIAKKHNGELTVSKVMAEMSISKTLALKTLAGLMNDKVCQLVNREDGKIYIFPAFKEKKQVKKCEYCESIFDLEDAQNDCPSCGAKLKTITTF